MEYARMPDSTRIRKINDPGYIKFKLYTIYAVISVFFICVGAIINHFSSDLLPQIIADDMMSFLIISEQNKKIIDFIASIIYNSIDIFKITFIIIIAGFTYVSGTISRVTAALWSTWCGFALCYCIDIVLESYSRALVSIMLVATIFYCVVFISNCVRAELTAQKFSEYRNANLLLTSDCFWKYIGGFLISFGYVLIIYTVYGFLFKLLM